MDSDDGFMDDCDESDDSQILSDDEDELPMDMEPPEASSSERRDDEEFVYEVLPADKIVEFMVDCIKEVNAVVQVSIDVNVHKSQSFFSPEWQVLYTLLFFLSESQEWLGKRLPYQAGACSFDTPSHHLGK